MSSHVGSAVVWNMSGEQAIGEPLGGPTDLTTDVSFSRDGTWLAAGRFDGGAIVYDTQTRRQILRIARRLGRHRSRVPSRWRPRRRRDDRREGAILRSRRPGRASGRPLGTKGSAVWQVAFSPDGRLLAVAVDPNGVEGFHGQQRQGEVRLWDVDSRTSRGAGDRAGRRIGALRGLQPGRHAARDRQLRRAARPVGRGHPGPPRRADDGGGRRRPGRRVRSERPARRGRRRDRAGACVARGRPAAGVSAAVRPHRPGHGSGFRSGRLVPRDHERVRRNEVVGPGDGSRLRRRARRKRESRTRSRPQSTFRSWGCGTRSARTASSWPSRESTSSACCGTSTPRSGAGVPARSWAET